MSVTSDQTNNGGSKQSIRRLEIPISKFNDVAIPHHLDLLRHHKNNIKKYQRMRNWELVRKEQINAARLTKQMEQLLYEMDTLRSQVRDEDIDKFDKLTFNSRTSTIAAIKEYLELSFEPPSATSSRPESPKNEDQNATDPLEQRQIDLHAEEEDLERQKACLHAWNSLQQDLQQLHQLFVDFNQIIMDQREQIENVENNVVTADINVQQGVKCLEKASKYKAAIYPVAGALLGTCLGGPVGLVAGLKLGGLTAIGGGLLGFTGATLLKKRQLAIKQESEIELKAQEETRKNNLTNSTTSLQSLTVDSKKKL
ncbi:syntaxin-17 [Venturia canescens]|uniref:syntaxin-17 n=1 Tax=Venturia canescens TaxID=32260 RepID=UPI001C9C1ADB|nr:syntaxin-17 [Venturia canescens]